MSLTYLTNASSGATRNAGTNGDLCALLDWALVKEGWAIEYTASNARVYRPGTGNRFRLHVRHDSAISGSAQRATVRGCESASSATSLTDAFPTTSQSADGASNWIVSNTADTTDRPFRIIVTPTFVIYATQASSTTDTWTVHFFGDIPSQYSSDAYNTVCMVRNVANNTIGTSILTMVCQQTITIGSSANLMVYWARDVSGAQKSSYGGIHYTSAYNSAFCAVTGTPVARGGYLNKIYREKVALSCCAANSGSTPGATATLKRGYIPQIWNPLHSGKGSITDADTFGDTAYHASASFQWIHNGSNGLILETTDTWSSP